MGEVRARRRVPELTLRVAVISSLFVLLGSTLLSAGVSVWERHQVSVVQGELRDRLRPAQAAVVNLTRAYVEQETGQRGFALTGQENFLEPYVQGRRDETLLLASLTTLLKKDAHAQTLLAEVTSAGERWQQDAAEPEIAARRQGPVTGDAAVRLVTQGKVLFDVLRDQLAAIDVYVDELTQNQLGQVAAAQRRANLTTAAAAVVALAVAGGVAIALPRSTTRPLAGLVEDLTAVAGGETRRRIRGRGPVEIRTIAAAAETMRKALVDGAAALAAAQHRVGVAVERDRVARRVGEHTLSQLYGLTLGLTRLRAAQPATAESVRSLVDQADLIARELRAIIHPLPTPGQPPLTEVSGESP